MLYHSYGINCIFGEILLIKIFYKELYIDCKHQQILLFNWKTFSGIFSQDCWSLLPSRHEVGVHSECTYQVGQLHSLAPIQYLLIAPRLTIQVLDGYWLQWKFCLHHWYETSIRLVSIWIQLCLIFIFTLNVRIYWAQV